MRKSFILGSSVLVIYCLHQDFWNWNRYEPLVLGFVPVGLAYHAAYSLVAAVLMTVLVRFAWPHFLEAEAKPSSGEETDS